MDPSTEEESSGKAIKRIHKKRMHRKGTRVVSQSSLFVRCFKMITSFDDTDLYYICSKNIKNEIY